MPTLKELIRLRESPQYDEQWRAAAQATIEQWERDASEAQAVGYGPEPDLPECPWHGEYLDGDGGCCLCYEQVGDKFAYREKS